MTGLLILTLLAGLAKAGRALFSHLSLALGGGVYSVGLWGLEVCFRPRFLSGGLDGGQVGR